MLSLPRAGGIAGRMSNTFTYADTSMIEVTIKSNPAGFITSLGNQQGDKCTVTTQSLQRGDQWFPLCLLDDQWGAPGIAQRVWRASKVATDVNARYNIVAHYVPSTEDTDGDGVMDWFESYQFGNLELAPR